MFLRCAGQKNAIPWFHLRLPCLSLIINACALINEYLPRGSVDVVHKMNVCLLRCDHKRTSKLLKTMKP